MNHATTRAMILPEIIQWIMRQGKMTEQEALHSFYSSATGEAFSDDDTGLYGQSPLYIFGLYCQEKEIPIPEWL